MSDLKPCPLCREHEQLELRHARALVKCRKCGCSASADAWNNRAAEPRPNPELPEGYRVTRNESGRESLEKSTIDGWVCVLAEINPTLFRNPYTTLLLADLQAIAAFIQGAR